jgi:hypothetical protein
MKSVPFNIQRRVHRRLRQQKGNACLSERIDVDRGNSKKFWKAVDSLLGRGRAIARSIITTESFYQFFAERVADVCASTNGALSRTFTRVWFGDSFWTFKSLLSIKIVSVIDRLPE